MRSTKFTSAVAAEGLPPRRRLTRLLVPLLVSNLALFSTYLGVNAVLLPTQVAALQPDPVLKPLTLSIVTGCAAAVALVAQPLVGALSDRSGRRNPWIVACAVLGGAATVSVAGGSSVIVLTIAWCVAILFLNGYQATVTAVVPDRVPRGQRGIASAFVGVATPLAAVVGVGIASRVADTPLTGYAVFGIFVMASASLFVQLNRERSVRTAPSGSLRDQLGSAAGALRHRDFLFAFLSRAAVMMAYLLVFHFLLYVLQERVQLPDGWSPTAALAVLTVVGAAAMVAGTLVGGLLADRLHRYRLFVLIGTVLMAAGSLAPLSSDSLLAMFAYIAIMGVGFGCFLAVDTAIVTLVLPRVEDAGRDLGVLNVANTVPQTLAAFVAGLIVAALGGGADAYGSLFAVSIGFAIVGGVCILGVRGVR